MNKNPKVCGHIERNQKGKLTCDLPKGHPGNHSGEMMSVVQVAGQMKIKKMIDGQPVQVTVPAEYTEEMRRWEWMDAAGFYPGEEDEEDEDEEESSSQPDGDKPPSEEDEFDKAYESALDLIDQAGLAENKAVMALLDQDYEKPNDLVTTVAMKIIEVQQLAAVNEQSTG